MILKKIFYLCCQFGHIHIHMMEYNSNHTHDQLPCSKGPGFHSVEARIFYLYILLIPFYSFLCIFLATAILQQTVAFEGQWLSTMFHYKCWTWWRCCTLWIAEVAIIFSKLYHSRVHKEHAQGNRPCDHLPCDWAGPQWKNRWGLLVGDSFHTIQPYCTWILHCC